MSDDLSPRLKIRNAAFRLAEERGWRDIRLADIAAAAEVSLADLAACYDSKTAILKGFARDIDRALLETLAKDPAEGSAHDRIFDIIIRRFEIMAPYRAALKAISRDAADGPASALTLWGSVLESQGWMLTAAGIEDSGLKAGLKQHGLAAVYLDALRCWLADDDPGMARTMALLDRRLREGAQWLGRIEGPVMLASTLFQFGRALLRRRPAPSERQAPRDDQL